MRTVTSDGSTNEHLHTLQRYKVVASIVVGCIPLLLLCWLLLARPIESFATNLSLTYPIAALVAAFCTLQVYQWANHNQAALELKYKAAWLLMGFALIARGIGEGYEGLLLYAGPSFIAFPQHDLIAWLAYPLLFAALFCLYGGQLRASMILDVCITSFAVIGIVWFLVAVPTNMILLPDQHITDLVPGLVRLLFSLFGDVFLLLFCLLALERGVESHFRPALLLIIIALSLHLLLYLFLIWVFCFQSSAVFLTDYLYMNVGHVVAVLLLGLAAIYHYAALLRVQLSPVPHDLSQTEDLLESRLFGRVNGRSSRLWSFNNLYVPLILLLCVCIFFQIVFKHGPQNTMLDGLFVIMSVAGALIVVRHMLISRENEGLLHERDVRFQESEQARFFVTQLTDILDLEYLRERIMDVILSKLGFTAVMLILLEKYDRPVSSQSHLLVSTASISTHMTRWKLVGDSLLYRVVAAGKQCEVQWASHLPDLPAEVRIWQAKLHMHSMLFFPILYQGKVLGSLGVSRHSLATVDPSAAAIVRIYTEQVATIIEHAHLYREARERETFALAMANIAKILNAAVLEPAEISQLICVEGANALHADYVLFYLCRQDELLEPLAALLGEQGRVPASHLQNWPKFQFADYEAEASHSLHPFLLDIAPAKSAETEEDVVDAEIKPAPRVHPLLVMLAQYAIPTAIMAPLVTGGSLSGVLIFARSHLPGKSNYTSFDDSDLPHAQDFVEQASVAFTNAQLYQRLRTAHQRLQELDQMKDQFMVTASHELRTPLTAVQGYIELIVQYDEVLPAIQRREFLHKAQLGCEELAILLRNVMDASRIEAETSLKPALISRVPVVEMIDKVQVMIEPQVTHEEREIFVSIDTQLSVYADPVRLHQVLINLATNALKYSNPGTPLYFSTSIDEQEHAVVISVSDRGKGITPQDQGRLFQRFYRLESDMNSPIRGSGLGLYISRRLIEAMGGKIWIESRGIPGEGSTFNILLPMA